MTEKNLKAVLQIIVFGQQHRVYSVGIPNQNCYGFLSFLIEMNPDLKISIYEIQYLRIVKGKKHERGRERMNVYM